MIEVATLAISWILILAPDCIEDNQQLELAEQMRNTTTQFDEYVGEYETVCMGGVDLYDIEDVTVPALRQIYPDSPLVFVWPDLQEYRAYFSSLTGQEEKGTAHSGLWDGFSVVAVNEDTQQSVKHELTHTTHCLAHDHSMDPVTKWYRVEEPPFCA